jgi:hypothetical protein
MSHQLTIVVLPELYAICRLDANAPVPSWASSADFFSITRTANELSIVCKDSALPEGAHAERERRLLQIEGTLAFSLTGVLQQLRLR